MVKVLSVMGLTLVLAPAALGSATHTETARLRVGTHVVHWHSARAIREVISIRVMVNGHGIPYEKVRNCISYAGGRGVSVKMDGCGRGAQHLRISAIALKPSKLYIGIRAR